MNARIKKLWVKALRSGKFRQTIGTLRAKDGEGYAYCCLGVLKAVRCAEEGIPFMSNRNKLLDGPTMAWAGLDHDDPILSGPTAQSTQYASKLNDDDKSFKYIADRIEKYL